MAQKWNLQDIKPPERGGSRPRKRAAAKQQRPQSDMRQRTRRKAPEVAPRDEESLVEEYDTASVEIVDGNERKKKRIIISAIIALVVVVVGVFFSFLMSGAEVTIHPLNREVNIQATFTTSLTPSVDELGYELMTLEAEGERQVSATGEEQVSARAEGTLFIYNAFSTKSQRLIKNTRFESPEGLIFRIDESVEVPGYTEDGGSIVPGVITATVFADGTGDQYNIPVGRFAIPGLEGTDQYETMYAESIDEFTGGFEGKRFIIDETELQTAKQALHMELRDALLSQLEEKRPAGFVLFDDAITFAFDSLPATEYGDELATIKERARLQVPIFKDTEFADYIARSTIPGYEASEVLVEDITGLAFAYPDPALPTKDIATLTELEFKLSGKAHIIWQYDESLLVNDLLGLPKTAFTTVLSGYPAIDTANVVIRPFWKQSFPNSASEVTVERVIGEKQEE